VGWGGGASRFVEIEEEPGVAPSPNPLPQGELGGEGFEKNGNPIHVED
jgi:hypothetical protein